MVIKIMSTKVATVHGTSCKVKPKATFVLGTSLATTADEWLHRHICLKSSHFDPSCGEDITDFATGTPFPVSLNLVRRLVDLRTGLAISSPRQRIVTYCR